MLKWGEALGISAGSERTTVSHFDYDESKTNWAFGVGDGIFLVPYRSNGRWRVTVLPIGDAAKSIVKAEIEPGSLILVNGLPRMFSVKLTYQNDKTRNLRLRHTDRFDREALLRNESLHLFGGYYPTVTIGLLGTVGAGKSCYQHSLCINTTLDRAAKLLGGKVISTAKDPKAARLPRNAISSFDGTPFEVTKEGKSKRKAQKIELVVFDTGGEISLLQNHSQSVFQHGSYRISDRLLADEVLDKARFLDGALVVVKGTSLLENGKRPLGDIEGLLRLYSEENGNIRKIIAISEADVIQEKLKQAESAHASRSVLANGARLHSSSPVFNPIHSQEDLRRHMALAGDILRDTHRYNFSSEDLPVCLVSACREESGDMMDFESGFNQELPFVWLLEHLVDMGGTK